MLKLYNSDEKLSENNNEKKGGFKCLPSDRRWRGRCPGRIRVGYGEVGVGVVVGLPGSDSSNVSNRESDTPSSSVRRGRSRLIGGIERIKNNNKINNNSSNNKNIKKIGLRFVARVCGVYVVKSYFGIFYKFASCVMGMFKWLRKDFVQWDRNRRNTSSPDRRGLNNKDRRKQTLTMLFERPGTVKPDKLHTSEIDECEMRTSLMENRANSESYRSALQAFLDRRREPGEGSEASQSPELSPTANNCSRLMKSRDDNNQIYYNKNTNNDNHLAIKYSEEKGPISGVPHVEASEVFEVGWVAGTEDRYLELISAEWQHTRTALRRSSHPNCFNAVRADLDILTEIRHPNTLLLMGTTRTDEHGIVAIFESVDCTLYNYVHEQGERVSVQGAARCAAQLADALRHAHARGIVHGAVTSHCVFLAASGTAKLGGWELAVRENEPKPYREWEERLRSEIFRWQAPEMFYGDAPSRACDVYALALLIWEMCTGRVPWSGLNEVEIERQYIHWERGISTDTYNFPPLLTNLLEAGLQLDVGKRKLDMNRMHRFLRRLELRYEDENPIYIDRHSNNNNNNPQIKTFNAPVSTSPLIKSPGVTPKRESIEIGNGLMGKKLFSSEKILDDNYDGENPRNDIYYKKYEPTFGNNENRGGGVSVTDFMGGKNKNLYFDSRKKNITLAEKLTGDRDEIVYQDGKRQRRSINDSERKINKRTNLVPCESSLSEASTATETPNTSGDESANDTMTDIKKLKEILASQRSKFFYGNNAPTNLEVSNVSDVIPFSPPSREKILSEARGKICEPCKPASHKINLESQLTKSPSEYNPTLIKPASHQNQRIPQSHLSTDLKQATSQPQTLNSSSSSFFETSLWRKEKLICLSKMRRQDPDDDQDLFTMSKKAPSITSGSPKTDLTYIIDNDAGDEESSVLPEDSMPRSETKLTKDGRPQSSPLQAVKEALDRATNIIRSVTPNTEDSVKLSPFESLNNSDIALDDTGVKESIFESLNRSKLGSNNADEEIKSIERSAMDDRDSLLAIGKPVEEIFSVKYREDEKEKSKYVSFGKTLCDFDTPGKELFSEIPNIEESLVERLHDLSNSCADDPNDSLNHLAEESLISTAMVFLSNKYQEKNCKSCQHRNLLARRRSLPAALGQLRSTCNVSPLGKLPIRRGDIPDNTVEDLYIDDEFGDNLNVNMVLLEDEGEPDNQDLISSLLDSTNV